jgi:hypothetical protein
LFLIAAVDGFTGYSVAPKRCRLRTPVMRSLLITIAWLSQLFGNCEGIAMDDLGLAPSKPGPDEVVVTDHAGFDECETTIALLADQGAYQVKRRTYTVSRRWGRVLRARMVKAGESSLGAPILTCWTGSGAGVQVSFDFYGPNISEGPASTEVNSGNAP